MQENEPLVYDPNAVQKPQSDLEKIVSHMRGKNYPMDRIKQVVREHKKKEEAEKLEAARVAKLTKSNDATAIYKQKQIQKKAMNDWSSGLEPGATFKNDEGVDYSLNADNQWTANGEVVDQDDFKANQLPQYYKQLTTAGELPDFSVVSEDLAKVFDATKITAPQQKEINDRANSRLNSYDEYYNGGGFDEVYNVIQKEGQENKYMGWTWIANPTGPGGVYKDPKTGQTTGPMNIDGTPLFDFGNLLEGDDSDVIPADEINQGGADGTVKSNKRRAYNETKNVVDSVKTREAIKRIAKEKGISPRDVDVESQEVKRLAESITNDDVREELLTAITEQERLDQIDRNVEAFIDQEGGAEGFDTKWYETFGMMKGDKQEDVAKEISKIVDDRDKEIKKIDQKQTVIKAEIDDIDEVLNDYTSQSKTLIDQIEKIKGGKYTTREEVDNANAEIQGLQDQLRGIDSNYNAVVSRRNDLMKTNGKIFENFKGLQVDAQKFDQYKDLLDRNYTGLATVGNGMVNWVSTTAQSFDEFAYRFNPLRLIKDDNGETPEWLKPMGDVLNLTVPGAGYLLTQAGESDEQRKIRHDKWNEWQENWSNKVQKPKAWDDVNGWYDFGEWSAGVAGNQIPQLAFMYATAGLGTAAGLGAKGMQALTMSSMLIPSAGGKFREMQEEMDMYPTADGEPLYSNAQLYGIAMSTGAVEALSEQVTFGQLNAAMNVGGDAFALGFNQYLKKSFGSQMARVGIDILEEGTSEALATLGENYLGTFRGGDHAQKSLWDGVDEAFVSGALISVGIKAMGTAKNPTAAFTSKDTNQKRGEIGLRLQKINDLISKPGLSDNLRNEYIGERNALIAESNKILQADIKKVDLMSGAEKKALINIETSIMQLRQKAESIAADDSMTPDQKKTEVERLENQVKGLESAKEGVLSRYTAMEAEENYQIEKQKVQQRVDAFNERQQQEGGEGRTAEMVETDTQTINENNLADLAEIDAEIAENQRVLENVDPDSDAAKTARSNIIEFNQRKAGLEGMSKQFGYISTDANGNSKFFINKDTNLANNNVTTPMHEFLHHALWATVKRNPKTQQMMGGALISDINNNASTVGDNFINKVNAYEGMDMQGEEVITSLSEAIKTGDVKYSENLFTKMGDTIRRYFQNNYPESALGKIKFNTGRDVYNFVKDFNDSIEKGYDSGAINNVIDKGAIGRLVDGKKTDAPKQDGQVYESRIYQETDLMYKENKTRWGNDRIRKGLAAQMAYGLEGDVMYRLRNFEGLTAEKQDIALDFIADDKSGLTGLIDGFDPVRMINKETGQPYESVMAYLLHRMPNGMRLIDARLLGFVQKNPKYGNIVQSMEQEGVQDSMEKQNQINENNTPDPDDTVIERESKRMFVNSMVIPDGKIVELRENNQDTYNEALQEVQAELDQDIKNNIAAEGTEVNLNTVNQRFVGKVIANEVTNANVDVNGLTYKGFQKLLKQGPLKPVLQVFADLYGVPIDKLIKDADLNQAQRGAAQNMFLLNADSNIQGLPDGHTASGTATGVPRVLLNMVNPETGNTDLLYKKTAAAKAAKTGSRAGLPLQVKQKGINKAHVQENLGIYRGKPNNAARGVDGMLRSFVIQNAMLASNQAVRQDALMKAENPFSVIKAVGDGKSDLYFAKIPKVDGGNITLDPRVTHTQLNDLLDFMEQNPQVATSPQVAVQSLADIKGVDVAEYHNAADFVGAEAAKFLQYGVSVENMIQAVKNIMPPAANFKNWKDVFVQNPDLAEFAPYDLSSKNKNKFNDVVKYKGDVLSFLKTLPTDLLNNNMFLDTFQNGAATDLFTKDELRAAVKDITKNRPAQSSDIDYSKVGFSETLANKLQDIANNNTDLTVANKQMVDAIENAGFSQTETARALASFLTNINEYVNEPGIKAQEKTNRMKMVSTLFQQNTNFKKGLLRGGAPVVAVSMTGGKISKTPIAKTSKINIARAYGIEGADAKAFGAIITGANPGITGVELARVQKVVDQRLQQELDSRNSDMTLDQYKELIKMSMVAPQVRISKGVVQAVDVKEFQKIKERHDEHMTPLLSFAGNNFINMANGTFSDMLATEMRDYTRTLLNEDLRKIMDAMPGLKTGNVDSDVRISPFARIIQAIPQAASDLLMIGQNDTLDRVIAFDVARQSIRSEVTAPIVKSVENALGPNGEYFSKNTDIIFDNIDARDAYGNLLSKHADPMQATMAATELVRIMENINDINDVKANLVSAYPVLNNDMTLNDQLSAVATIDNAIMFSRNPNNPSKGITILDFDDTLATSKSKILYTKSDGTKGSLTPAQYAKNYQEMLGEGTKFDFSQFNEVIDGKIAPLFNKAMKLQGKFGPKNMFVLTARPAESAPAIHAFLQANGLKIPLDNITGLANSTAEAKALWIAEKVGQGYNDIYFADDALQNVQVVKNVLDQMDVKSKVQQAKTVYYSKMSNEFNQILEDVKGIRKEATFSDAKARKRGAQKGKFDWFIPASAEDFKGLLYKFLGKGKKGEAQLQFFKEALMDPFAKGIRAMDAAKNRISNDLKALNKQFKGINKLLKKTIPTGDFTYDTAARVYNWNKLGYDIPGISKTDLANMIKAVESNPDLAAYADGLNKVAGGIYPQPGPYWTTETIASDLYNMSEGANRKDALAEFIENRKQIFGEWENGKLVGENMNKIEAVYGTKYREALTDMLWRMENGTNRNFGGNRLTNRFANWVNNSVGAIMFFNMRSAVLQTLSTVNFVNWSFNNPLKAGMAFANQPQFWKDFSMIFNSDMLQQRRSGLKTSVSHAELAEAASGSKTPVKAVFAKLMKMGFLPTQIADSFAIASGGATFYRNRVNDLIKQGVSEVDAKKQAFQEFQAIAEETQQSSRPDMISSQQASPLGRLILAFQNTPMQYTRLIKKATLDLANGRGDMKTNISKIIYYGAIQNAIFAALQKGLFAIAFSGDDDEEKLIEKEIGIANSMLDSVLRGTGVGGAVVSTIKNIIMKAMSESDKGWSADEGKVVLQFLNLSPPIGSKARKLNSGLKTLKFKGENIKDMSMFDINNPLWNSIGHFVSFSTNVPLDRAVQKAQNISEALNADNATWQRIALMMGWNTWDLDVKNKAVEASSERIKLRKEEEKKKKKEEKKKEKERLRKEQEAREVRCSAKTRKGKGPRCKNRTENKSGRCYSHQ